MNKNVGVVDRKRRKHVNNNIQSSECWRAGRRNQISPSAVCCRRRRGAQQPPALVHHHPAIHHLLSQPQEQANARRPSPMSTDEPAASPAAPAAPAAADQTTPASGPPPSSSPDKRGRKRKLDVNPDLILATEGRTRRRRTPSPVPEVKKEPDPHEVERVKTLGTQLVNRIMAMNDPKCVARVHDVSTRSEYIRNLETTN